MQDEIHLGPYEHPRVNVLVPRMIPGESRVDPMEARRRAKVQKRRCIHGSHGPTRHEQSTGGGLKVQPRAGLDRDRAAGREDQVTSGRKDRSIREAETGGIKSNRKITKRIIQSGERGERDGRPAF